MVLGKLSSHLILLPSYHPSQILLGNLNTYMSILSTRQAIRAVNIYISDAQDKYQSRGQTKEEVSSAKAEVVFL
jgi:hypothetical protein